MSSVAGRRDGEEKERGKGKRGRLANAKKKGKEHVLSQLSSNDHSSFVKLSELLSGSATREIIIEK